MSYDAAQALTEYLQTSTDAAAIAVRALIVGAAVGIVDSAELKASLLGIQEEQRRADDTPTKVLMLAVQDAGERTTGSFGVGMQAVVVRMLDRQCGMRNIRPLRRQLVLLLRERVCNITEDGGLVQLKYTGRTGHMLDPTFGVTYEALTLSAAVTYKGE